jgi:signal transduction histidine kinase
VRLAVSDEGEGIAPADLERVFERFYRSDTARVGGSGTGLGLAIAKEIVEAHGSCIRVDSLPGRGSDFWFELPAA